MRRSNEKVKLTCETCGIVFFKQVCECKKRPYRFCSRPCLYASYGTSEERFWAKVNKTDSCWLWTGRKSRFGHGYLFVDGKQKEAHRFSYEIHFGPLLGGEHICHNCPGGDNPACVNPAHLFVGTHKINMEDAAKKKRFKSGDSHWKCTINAQQEEEIKARYQSENISMCQLGREYGVAHQTISRIIKGQNWRAKIIEDLPEEKPLLSGRPTL